MTGRFMIFFLAVGVLSSYSLSGQFTYKFENMAGKGLGNGNVTSIIQDSHGFMWVGTGQGLYQYDGYSFKLLNVGGNDHNLMSNTINCLYEDTDRTLWIGTGGGVYQYNPASNDFRNLNKLFDQLQISSSVKSINQDNAGNIWITTETHQERMGSLVFYDRKEDRLQKFNDDGLFNWPRTIVRDEFGNFWIVCDKGLVIFDPQGKHVIKRIASINEPGMHDPPASDLSNVYFEHRGVMWATAYNGGATKIKYDSAYSLSLMNINRRNDQLVSDCVMAMTKDSQGYYWIATLEGLSIFNRNYSWHHNLTYSPTDQNGFRDSFCKAVMEDRSGNIWIAHAGGGLSRLLPNKGFIQLTVNSIGSAKLAGSSVHAVYVDPVDNLWVGINELGIQKFTFDSGYSSLPRSAFYPFKHRVIWEMEKIDDNTLFIGAEDDGLNALNLSTGEIKRIYNSHAALVRKLPDESVLFSQGYLLFIIKSENGKMNFHELIPDSTTRKRPIWPSYSCISKESDEYYWISTWQGDIYRYDVRNMSFTKPEINPYELLRISHVHLDKNHNLWVTAFEGVYKFKITQESPHHVTLSLERKFTEKDGLVTKAGASNLYTASMVEDGHGNLWLGQVGLTKLDPRTEKVEVYDVTDGLPSNSISQSTADKMKSGHLVFCTNDGIFLFHPDSLRRNLTPPPIAITKYSILNRPSLIVAKSIDLEYDENVITFEFSALDFTIPEKNQYAYQMVGFDNDWVYSGTRRTATYTNLDPGMYTFKVKGSNNDGIWNENGSSIMITILPPPWRTWWAYTGYGILMILTLILARREIIKREHLKSTAKLKELEAEKYHELDLMKSRFFANVSHEFRTPLTLLLGPIEKRLSSSTSVADKNEFSIMHNNARRLLTLVNQLLDLSRLESGSLRLQCSRASLNNTVEFISSQFASMAASRNINFRIESQEEIELFIDVEKLEKILSNLLSNAFKFTPSQGAITVTLSTHDADNIFPNRFAKISVKDTGIGISATDLPRIFDRFYQVDSSATRQYEGSGIGLALVKELTELHHGVVSVTSTPGEGTTFTVSLPLGSDHLSADEISNEPDETNLKYSPLEVDAGNIQSVDTVHPKILVVEDNADLRHYLRTCLSGSYNILEAKDGYEGFAIAVEEIPDLIISDLMMPVMDGIELTKKIKQEEKTSHIPIILLTAKADVQTKLEGLKTGADDYITKPFSQDELSARINNLITIRKRLQEKYARQLHLLPSQLEVDSAEDRFVKKVMTIIEQHMDDTSFGVEVLSQEAAMSNTQLYRKLKSVTGFTPNELIRNTRLERAASLLRQRAGNVADIAYQVGFNNLSYFSKCFKEKFGCSPSEYLSQG